MRGARVAVLAVLPLTAVAAVARSPGPPRAMTLQGHYLCWTAPGAAGSRGTASSYELRAFAGRARPRAGTFVRGRRIGGVPAPGRAGTRQCTFLRVLPSGTRWLALRAVDSGGLTGRPASIRVLFRA